MLGLQENEYDYYSLESEKTHTIKGVKVDTYYDNNSSYKPWKAFVVGHGVIARSNTEEGIIVNAKKFVDIKLKMYELNLELGALL